MDLYGRDFCDSEPLYLAHEFSPSCGVASADQCRRTVVWFKDLLVGRKRELVPLLEASLSVESALYVDETSTLETVLVNHSDARLELRNLTASALMEHADRFSVPAC